MNKDVVKESQEAPKRPKRTKGLAAREVLPSTGLSFESQLKILRAYVTASEGGTKVVTLERIAAITQFSRFTVSSCNAFFAASNFIDREKNGYRPTEGLVSFIRQQPWNEEQAKGFLRTMMKDTWYEKELRVLFEINPEMTAEELINALGSVVSARTDQKGALETLMKFVSYAGLVVTDAETGKTRPAKVLVSEGEPLPSEVELGLGKAPLVPEEKRIKVGGVAATFAVNLNLTLDITTGTPDEHVRKIKDILEGLGKEE